MEAQILGYPVNVLQRGSESAVIEPILLGMVLGFVPVTIAGLLVAAWLQYKQGNPSGLGEK